MGILKRLKLIETRLEQIEHILFPQNQTQKPIDEVMKNAILNCLSANYDKHGE